MGCMTFREDGSAVYENSKEVCHASSVLLFPFYITNQKKSDRKRKPISAIKFALNIGCVSWAIDRELILSLVLKMLFRRSNGGFQLFPTTGVI